MAHFSRTPPDWHDPRTQTKSDETFVGPQEWEMRSSYLCKDETVCRMKFDIQTCQLHLLDNSLETLLWTKRRRKEPLYIPDSNCDNSLCWTIDKFDCQELPSQFPEWPKSKLVLLQLFFGNYPIHSFWSTSWHPKAPSFDQKLRPLDEIPIGVEDEEILLVWHREIVKGQETNEEVNKWQFDSPKDLSIPEELSLLFHWQRYEEREPNRLEYVVRGKREASQKKLEPMSRSNSFQFQVLWQSIPLVPFER